MKRHLAYLWYITRHKWFVFVAGLDLDVPLHLLIIHDWSKFLPDEWIPYANFFHGPQPPSREAKDKFLAAWKRHLDRNPHHWQYWQPKPPFNVDASSPTVIPQKYTREMVADWMSMSRTLHGTWSPTPWYVVNKSKIRLHPMTRREVEVLISAQDKRRGRKNHAGEVPNSPTTGKDGGAVS
jgi:hypothetical protein